MVTALNSAAVSPERSMRDAVLSRRGAIIDADWPSTMPSDDRIGWRGPASDADWISMFPSDNLIGCRDSTANASEAHDTRPRTPLRMKAPGTPGTSTRLGFRV